MSEPDPESRFRQQLFGSTSDVKEAFERLASAIRSLDSTVFPYFTNRPDLRYSTSDVPATRRGYHPFVHISSGKAQLEVHLKDVDDPQSVTRPRSPTGGTYARSFPRKVIVKNPAEVSQELIANLRQSLWIMRKDFLEK